MYIEKTNHYTYFKYELCVWNTTNQLRLGQVTLLVERFGYSYVKVIFSKWLHYLECSVFLFSLPSQITLWHSISIHHWQQHWTGTNGRKRSETSASKLKVGRHRSSASRGWWSFSTVFGADWTGQWPLLSISSCLSSASQAWGSIYQQTKTKWVFLIFQVWIHLDDSLKCVLIGFYW